jgi:hypothetical protein
VLCRFSASSLEGDDGTETSLALDHRVISLLDVLKLVPARKRLVSVVERRGGEGEGNALFDTALDAGLHGELDGVFLVDGSAGGPATDGETLLDERAEKEEGKTRVSLGEKGVEERRWMKGGRDVHDRDADLVGKRKDKKLSTNSESVDKLVDDLALRRRADDDLSSSELLERLSLVLLASVYVVLSTEFLREVLLGVGGGKGDDVEAHLAGELEGEVAELEKRRGSARGEGGSEGDAESEGRRGEEEKWDEEKDLLRPSPGQPQHRRESNPYPSCWRRL